MRKLLWLCLTFALLLAALILAPLSGATKNGRSSGSLQAGKTATQQMPSGPRAVQAVNFAESIAVRDFPAAEGKKFAGKVQFFEKGNSDEGERVKEISEQYRQIPRRTDPNAPQTADQSLSTNASESIGPPPNLLNPPTVNFDGISIANTIAIGQGFFPPDTSGEAGPNHYVQAVNVAFRVWDKAGNPLTPVASLNTLFGPLGGKCGNQEDGEPIVLYDQLADRWFISQFCTVADPNNHQLIAVSKTGDPAGAYYLYDFMMPNNKFNEYSKFGMWPDAYYMTDNQFNQAATAFLQAGVFAFDRSKMLVGDPTAAFIYFDTAVLFPPGGINGPDGIGGMLPADMDGYVPPPAGAPCPFAYIQATEFGEPADQLRLFDFHVDFSTPANSTFTERTGSPLPVAAFDPIPVPNSRNVVPQPPPATSASFLDAVSDRLMFRLSYRNFGTSETLVANHTVNAATNPLFRAGVRFYQLNRTTPTGAFTVGEQQTWAPADTEHRWMGSAANNFQGDVAVGFSTSGLTTFPSIRYAARLGTDTAGTGLAQGETSIVVGGGSQTSTSGRWGGYSDMTVDPTDDCSFWYTQEYYLVSAEPGNTSAPWHTRIAKFAPGPCATSPRGTISGTVTNCATGLPVLNAFVSISGGYSRATDAAGTYSAVVIPGTYNASVTRTGYDTAATTGVVLTNGGSATFNACLNGILKQPVADTASITADSCNSNGAIDPNETINISLGVKNTGTLNTVNLVGTLQATGGVLSPSGPQNYGVVVADGATVFRTFTFTAANLACGAPLVISLQLQDGATDLGTVTYNFTTGVIAVSNYSTGDIAVPIPDSPAPAVNIPITVADVMTLSDVNVSFRINHAFDGDLQISLVHPDNTVIPLVTNRGSSGVNFGTGSNDCSGVPTLIDDQATTAISAGSAPFAASFKPESPLSALNGKTSNGTWNLRIQDTASVDTGTVGCVKLELNKRSVCCGALINALPPPVITAESISPANNAADPQETVLVNLSLINVGGSNTTNLVATLQPTGGVSSPSGPQSYGVVTSLGPAVTRPFLFTAQGACGSNITLTLALQDGATNLGTVTYTMTLGAPNVTTIFTENFDGVTAPALPAGWVTAHTGVEVDWVTSTTNPNSAPNDAFAPDVSNIGNTTLDTPTINVPAAGGQLTFRNLFNMEASTLTLTKGFDGMVLEISINGGAFNDITTGGNPFIAGGYTRTIDSGFSSPIAGRMAWSGLSGGTTAAPTYITSTINLPAAAAGQPIKLRWRAASDSSAIAAGAAGVRIDNISVAGTSFVCNSGPPNVAPVNTVPGPQSMTENGTRTFSTGNGNAISIADADAGSNPVSVQLNATNGVITLGGTSGLTFTVGDGTADATMTFTGTITNINAALNGLVFTSTPGFSGAASLQIVTNDQGNSGSGGPLSDSDTVSITVNEGDTLQFSAATYTVAESGDSIVITVQRSGDTTQAATVNYVTSDDSDPTLMVRCSVINGIASSRCDFTTAIGRLSFAAGDTSKTFTVLIDQDSYVEGLESLTLTLSSPTGASVLGAPSTATLNITDDPTEPSTNAIDDTGNFVRQHYLDFLNREKDTGGFNAWVALLSGCAPGNTACDRVTVSQSFFGSPEFKSKGYFATRFYFAAFNRNPLFLEFSGDLSRLNGATPAESDAAKASFPAEFTQRAEFHTAFDSLTNAQYVDTLIASTGVAYSNRNQLVADLDSSTKTRAQVLNEIVEATQFVQNLPTLNRAFVLAEYFGYLRRNPDTPGFNAWLNYLTTHPGDFRTMVNGFVNSREYRIRFGTP